MKFQLSINDFLVDSNVEADMAFAPVAMHMVPWIKQLREDCGFIETTDGKTAKIGLKDAKNVADLLRAKARERNYLRTSFILDTQDHPELSVLCEQEEIMKGKSEIVRPIGIKIPKVQTSEDILKQTVNKLIKQNCFNEAIQVLYILQAKAEEEE